MSDRVNRRDLIVDTASRLFIQYGYEATSIRQIAEAVGCAEAALYYHFKGGKHELFQASLEAEMPDLLKILEGCEQAKSLPELIRMFGQGMAKSGQQRMARIRLIASEYPRLAESEQQFIHSKHLAFQAQLLSHVERFVISSSAADALAWVLICAFFGYGHLFVNIELSKVSDFTAEEFVDSLADLLAC